jgi:predicted nucleic acid-binding protein
MQPRTPGELAVILADTDVLIDYLAGVQPVAAQILRYVESDQLKTSAISCFELLSGAAEGTRGDAVRRLVAELDVLFLDRDAAERAAGVRRELEATGQTIGMGDSLIAGIALAHKAPVFTRNRKHFERVPGLGLIEVEA